MNFKSVAKIESFGSYPVGVDVQISSPHMSQETESAIRHFCNNMASRLYYDCEAKNPAAIAAVAKEKEQLLALFPEGCGHKEIPNGYDNDPNRPWFKIFTLKGPITIGWRKRVVEIDWSETVIDKDGIKLFGEEKVTVERTLVHAWGYEKAQEYVKALLA